MSISFESAVETLKTMFPDWDEETLSTILVSNHYHVENTIETVLSMSGQNEVSTQQQSNNNTPQTNQLIDNNDDVEQINPPPPPVIISSSSGSSNNYRGTRVDLPNSFLRPPGWEDQNSYILADEELALMLQNELFQQQARQVEGGAELIALMERSNAQSRRRQQVLQQYPHANATTRQSSANNIQTQPSTSSSSESTSGAAAADLGIMKALSSMGTATKKSLSQLAQGFKSNNNSSNNNNTSTIHTINNTNINNSSQSNSSSTSHRNSFSGSNPLSPSTLFTSRGTASKRNSKNFQSLQDQDINHEDIYDNGEETEVITFGGSGTHRHILNNDDESPNSDGNNAENPLLKQVNFQHLNISKKE